MILYEGTYSWDGKRTGADSPVSWWPGSYNIKIIDLNNRFPGAVHIRPYLCLFTSNDSGYCVKDKFHNLAVKISKKFNLDPEKVIWVEGHLNKNIKISDIAVIEAVAKLGNEKIFKTIWRKAMPNELSFIKKCGLVEQ